MSAPEPGRRDAFDVPTPGPTREAARDAAARDAARDPSRESHADHVPLGGVPRALREAAELTGMDPIASLFNEALRYSQDNLHRLARERLQMLLCMAPDDVEARVMLAQVLLSEQRWGDALTALREAEACGVTIPESLRRRVEEEQAEARRTDDTTGSGRGTPSEVKALRLEARRLRTDTAQQQQQIVQLEREVKKWAWATAGVSVLTMAFVVGSLVLGTTGAQTGPATEVPTGDAAVEAQAAPAPAPRRVPPAAPVPTPAPAQVAPAVPIEPADDRSSPPPAELPLDPVAVEAAARDALQDIRGLQGDELTIQVREPGQLVLTGSVLSFRQRRMAERALQALPGIRRVDASGVELLVRTRGAIHVVEKGDTLTQIAVAYYGSSSLADRIQEANGVEANVLRIGQKLTIPPLAR